VYVDLRPWDTRPVQVRHRDGVWYEGELECYRRIDGRWQGRVRYSVGVGMQHVDWLTEDHLRPLSAVTVADLHSLGDQADEEQRLGEDRHDAPEREADHGLG